MNKRILNQLKQFQYEVLKNINKKFQICNKIQLISTLLKTLPELENQFFSKTRILPFLFMIFGSPQKNSHYQKKTVR